MQPPSHADRLMMELRGKIESISSEAANSGEKCVAFKKADESLYAEWRKRHAMNGYVLARDNATVKTAYLHAITCPMVGGDESVRYTKTPKVGCPTKSAALAFAQRKLWKVIANCDQCPVAD